MRATMRLCPRYMKAYFPPDNNGIQIAGVVLLPDHFVPPALTNTFISESDINEPNTVGVMLDWQEWGKMEAAGAVFLPCAGLRETCRSLLDIREWKRYFWWAMFGNGQERKWRILFWYKYLFQDLWLFRPPDRSWFCQPVIFV